jgi:hypothetical protein
VSTTLLLVPISPDHRFFFAYARSQRFFLKYDAYLFLENSNLVNFFFETQNQKCCPIHWLRESHMVNCENGQKPIQHWYTHRSWDRAPTRPLRQKTIPYQAEIAALAPTPTPRLDIRQVRHPKTQELRSSHYAYNVNNTRTHTWRQQGPTPNRHRKLGIDLTHHRGWVMGHVGQTPLLEYVSGGLYILCIGLHTGCVWSLISVNNLCKTLASYCLI